MRRLIRPAAFTGISAAAIVGLGELTSGLVRSCESVSGITVGAATGKSVSRCSRRLLPARCLWAR